MNEKKTIIIVITLVLLLGVGIVVMYLNPQVPNNRRADTATSTGTINNTTEPVTISKNLNTPWSVVFYNGIPLISSRNTGEILEIAKDGSTRVVGKVSGATRRGEGGLLGLALDSQKRLYTYYTTKSDNRISRFTLGGEPGNLSLGTSEIIIEGLPSASFHDGGRIAFGPDSMLYVTVGDAGNTTSAQDLTKLNGKILRMTPDGDIPKDNPFPGSLVYSYGHRNPQGLAWAADGRMFATEFGQNTWDELNIIEAGSNYGWPNVEGIEKKDGYVVPVQQWATRDASPSGMTYADGMLYIANLRGEVLRIVPVNNLTTSVELYKKEYGRIRDVAVSPDGRLWFLTNNTDGRGKPSETDDRIISIPLR